MTVDRRPIATVLFDGAHGEAWTIRSEVGRAIQPSHPRDASYELAARALRERGLDVWLSDADLDAIETFVRGDGSLVVLGEEEQDKYANNVNALLERFGIEIANDAVSDYEHQAARRTVRPARVGAVRLSTADDGAASHAP